MDQAGQQRTLHSSWRKSSYSGGSGAGNCVEVAWRKSSYSGNSGAGNCVEVAFGADAVLLRDSKNAAGPSLAFADGDWQAFLADLA